MKYIKDFLSGIVIGIANIIPGVSGGTMALVLGIYERLINAIHNISFDSMTSVVGLVRFNRESFERFTNEMNKIDALYLIRIFFGALVAVVLLAKLMTFLLISWHDPTYGFFFGLVLASALVPYKLIKKKTIPVLLMICLAAAGLVGVSQAMSGEKLIEKARFKQQTMIESGSLLKQSDSTALRASRLFGDAVKFFFMGAVAISAMILPGVSGSFLLLLMGGYFDVLRAITSRDFGILGSFALGCLVGMIFFSRFLEFLLRRWYDLTMAFLLGLVIGSLWMIWPFKATVLVGGETVYLHNIIPASAGLSELYTCISFIAGVVIVVLLMRVESSYNKKSGDTGQP